MGLANRDHDHGRGHAARRLALTLAAGLLLAAVGAAKADSHFAAGRLWIAEDSLADAPPEVREWRVLRNQVNTVKPLLALAGAAVMLWSVRLRRRPRATRERRVRDALLAALGVLGFAGWWNFGLFHYPDFVHPHELFHYVIGAKYYPELGYTRLYDCAVVADVEAGLGEAVARRSITDLRSYERVPASRAAAQPERCKRHFSPERWALFKRDMAWFRARMTPAAWAAVQLDHGYNPTPVWGILGRALVGSAPLDESRVATLSLVDPVLELLLWAFAFWGFGWRASCVALLYWGTNHPAEYGWVGGSYLRHDWLVASVAGIALLRHGSPAAAGFLLGWAGLLRVFPFLLLLPLGFRSLLLSFRARRPRLAPGHARVAGGALLAVVVALPLSLWSAGSGAWPAFVDDIRLHAESPTSTSLGLATLVAFAPDARETQLAPAGLEAAWKQARRENRAARWPVFALLAALFTALVARAACATPDWEAAILGVGLVPVLLEPSSYYTAAFLAYGFLATRHEWIGAALCLLSLAGWVAAARWLAWDDISVATSVALLAFVAAASLLAAAPAARRQ